MTDEQGWQAYLDAHPQDSVARGAFADWLAERDDPRAEGMRALAELGRWPHYFNGSQDWGWFEKVGSAAKIYPAVLPWWFGLTLGATRREAEDAAAIAYLRLSPADRAGLMSGERA